MTTDTNADNDRSTDTALPTLRAALAAVRREALKARLVYAIVDAAITATLVLLALTWLSLDAVPEVVQLPVPRFATAAIESLAGTTVRTLVLSGVALVALVVAVVVFVLELLLTSRRDEIRWFESVNPDLGVALRTARDTADNEATNVMATDLYREVLARLGNSSGAALLDRSRLLARLAVVVLVVGSAGASAAFGVSLDIPTFTDPDTPSDGQDPDVPPADGDTDSDDDGLAPGEDILGEPTEVPRGQDPEDIYVDPGRASDGDDRPYDTGGFPSGSVDVDAESAGFAPPEVLADADLIREYAVAIRTNTTGGADGG